MWGLKKPESTAGSLLELVMIVAVALGLALGIQKFLIKPYRIPSESMVPTLKVGQRVLVNRIGHAFSKPSVGDVVVFHPPKGAESAQCGVAHPRESVCPESVNAKDDVNFIKRVVAGPGDTIAVEGGHVDPQRQGAGGAVHRALRPRRRLQLPARRSRFPPGSTS